MRLGYSTWGMPSIGIDQAVEHIAQLGYDGIEIAVLPKYTTSLDRLDAAERKRIGTLLRERELELTAIAGHASLMEMDPQSHARNVAKLKGAIDLAVELAQGANPPFVNTLSGGKPEEWDDQRQLFVERLAEVVEYATGRGVVLAMEPHIGMLVDTPDRMITVLEMVDSPNLKVNFDISHFDILGMSMEENISTLIAYTVHTHVKDQRGRYPDHAFLIPGEGTFDYVKYLQTMQHFGYSGFVNAEVSVMVQRRPDYDPLEAATLAYETLSRAFSEAGIARETGAQHHR